MNINQKQNEIEHAAQTTNPTAPQQQKNGHINCVVMAQLHTSLLPNSSVTMQSFTFSPNPTNMSCKWHKRCSPRTALFCQRIWSYERHNIQRR
jgi:hypothetical protein